MKRESWKSRIGFIWAAVGSAVGLGSIWRFPYVMGANGGAAFIILYIACLALVGFPVLIAENLMGRTTQTSPSGAFRRLGKNRAWGGIGVMTVITGFLVSAFYGVVSGWSLGYLFQAFRGKLTEFTNPSETLAMFQELTTSPYWSIGFQFIVMALCFIILYTGVKKGIEAGNKVMMPMLFVMLLFIVVRGSLMPGAEKGIHFLFKPDWSLITGTSVLMALGQAFFSLSLGQGTMITYGSYLSKKENLPTTCFPIALFSTAVSLLAGIGIFTIVFSLGLSPDSGEGLAFQTLPLVFSQIPGGYALSLGFFALLFLAALSSEISAMEPFIAYLIDEKKWPRHKASFVVALCAFVVGVPCALSFGALKDVTIFGKTIFGALVFLCLNILIPLGGFCAVFVTGWRWGLKASMHELRDGSGDLFNRFSFLEGYFRVGIKYTAPIIIIIIFLNSFGVV
jgi:neurotransmitter:Na+ symporter, NSS family